LMRAEKLYIDIGMRRLLDSRGKDVVVEEFKLVKIDVIYEHDGYINALSKTNVQTILDFMSKKDDDKKNEAEPPKPKPEEKPEKEEEEEEVQGNFFQRCWRRCCGKREEKHDDENARKYSVQEVQLVDIGVKIANKFGHIAQDISKTVTGKDAEGGIGGVRLAVADMHWKNFTEEFGAKSSVDVINIVFKSLLKTILANTAGKDMAENMM